MRTFATALALSLAALVAPTVRAQTVSSQLIQTGTVSNTIYNNGNIGGDCNGGTLAFFFNGDEPLCGAGFLLGRSSTNVIGDAYILTAATGWTPVSLGPSTYFEYAAGGYTQGYEAVFTNAANSVRVQMNAYYSAAIPDVILYHYIITNTGTADLTNVYPGMFWDWDIGGTTPSGANTAAVDLANRLLYVQDPSLTSGTVAGTAVLTSNLSGWKYDVSYPTAAGQPQSRAELWTGLTTQGAATSAARDQRGTIGTGPYTIQPGTALRVTFALGAGTSLADLQANIAAAQVAVQTVAGEADPEAAGYAIRPAQPNPVRTTGAVSYTIPTDSNVRVTMYDALGRTVATLADGAQSAGDHTVQMDASALAPGVYVVRIEAGGRQMTQRVSVVR